MLDLKTLTLGSTLALVAGGLHAASADWPRYLGPDGDGRSEETGLSLAWSAEGPPRLWRVEAGEGYAGPAVADGRLFLFDRQGDSARLTCLRASDGERLWQVSYPTDYEDMYGFSNGPRTTPVVDGDRIYTFGAEGRLRCHRVADGELIWEVDTAERYGVVQNFFGVGSSPLVEGDLLIVPVGGSPAGSPGVRSGAVEGDGSGIVAFDKKTGKERYRITDELASYSSPVARTIGDRRFVFALMRGGLVAFEPRGGKVDFGFPWRARRLESVNAANPVVVGDRVLISESYGPGSALLRVRPGGFDLVRKDPPRGKTIEAHWATPLHHEGYVYACSGMSGGDAVLRAVALESGEIAWSKKGLGRFTLIYADEHLIVLTEGGELLAVQATPAAYREVSRSEPLVRGPAYAAPVLSTGLLYLRGRDGLLCLDLRGE